MNCPKCNAQMGGRFCPECGYDTLNVKKCPDCGAEMKGKFCESCGYSDKKKEKKGSFFKRHKAVCVIGILLILCAAAAVPFVMNMMKSSLTTLRQMAFAVFAVCPFTLPREWCTQFPMMARMPR